MRKHRALPVGSKFRLTFRLLPALFLIPGLPAVGNFRQEPANLLDLLLSPTVHAHPSKLNDLWLGYLTRCDVAAQGGRVNSQPTGCVSC